MQVAALEVQNVKRAINRYGTLPKGDRIGAYLESLRQASPPPSPGSKAPGPRLQQPGHMTRSNSSGGFQSRAAPDLEFPPPPPPEDLDTPAPSVEEASFRFGVSLRHREPSTDSCSSAKSEPPRVKPPSPPLSTSPPRLPATASPPLEDPPPASQKTPGEFKVSLRKVSLPDTSAHPSPSPSAPGVTSFKAQLKKFEPAAPSPAVKKETPRDVKARLKRVDGSPPPPMSKSVMSESEEVCGEEGEDKRRSTGSISSLKKLWEGGESPPESKPGRVLWPPEEKPQVPCKPLVRSKPLPSPAIYATPGVLTSVLELWAALDSSLSHLRTAPTVGAAAWLQLSDKLGLFHSSCLSYADTIAPPHARFHLRELLTRLEGQAQQLKSSGTRNQADNSRIVGDLYSVLRDIVAAVQR